MGDLHCGSSRTKSRGKFMVFLGWVRKKKKRLSWEMTVYLMWLTFGSNKESSTFTLPSAVTEKRDGARHRARNFLSVLSPRGGSRAQGGWEARPRALTTRQQVCPLGHPSSLYVSTDKARIQRLFQKQITMFFFFSFFFPQTTMPLPLLWPGRDRRQRNKYFTSL